MAHNDYNSGLRWCLLLLKYRCRSEQELAERLTRKGFAADIRNEIISYLRKRNYVNDQRFVEELQASYCKRGFGPRKYAAALSQYGISQALVQRALADTEPFFEALKVLVKQKVVCYRGSRGYARLMRFLIARGFEIQTIETVLSEEEIV